MTDISVHSSGSPYPSHHGFQSTRPDDQPLASRVWDAARKFGRDSTTVQVELYEALSALEAEVIELRGRQ